MVSRCRTTRLRLASPPTMLACGSSELVRPFASASCIGADPVPSADASIARVASQAVLGAATRACRRPDFRREGEAQAPPPRPSREPLLRGVASAAGAALAGALAPAAVAADARRRHCLRASTRRLFAPALLLGLVCHRIPPVCSSLFARCHRGTRISYRLITPRWRGIKAPPGGPSQAGRAFVAGTSACPSLCRVLNVRTRCAALV